MLRWAWSVTNGHRAALLVYFLLELMAIGLSLLFVFWSKQAIDMAMDPSSRDLRWVSSLVVISVLAGLALRAVSGWMNERTRLQIGLKLQREMIDVQMRSLWKSVKKWHSGDIQVRVNADCQEVSTMVGYSAMAAVLTGVRLAASFTFLWILDPMLAFTIVGITPLFLFTKVYFRRMRRLSQQIKQSESDFGEVLQENLRWRMLIRAMDLLNGRKMKLEEQQNRIFKLRKELLNFSTLSQTAMKVTINAGYLVTFIWGIHRLHAGEISFGTMTAFLQLVSRIQTPMMSLIGFVPLFIRFRTAAERVMELRFEETEPTRSLEKIDGLQSLHVADLSLRYEGEPILKDFSMLVNAGAPVAIVGSSGKGKTSLMRLLLALLKPERGEIWLESAGGRHALKAEHRSNFAYVPQGNSLFSGSIRENLVLQNPGADDHRIQRSLWLACAEFVNDLPGGLETRIGEGGHGLSEGQAQRIAIARAMMRDCDIWLFDEISSALDHETAGRLMDRLLAEGKGRICIFVTHDLKLAARCQQVLYI